MKLIGLMPVRNESWVLGLSARVALKWCDELVCLDHASTDDSADILRQIAKETGRLTSMHLTDPDWNEMDHRQTMLTLARNYGASHIALVDADEILTANLVPTIRDHVSSLPASCILQLPLYNMRGSITRYHGSGVWGRRITSVAFMDNKALEWTGDTFHHREPAGKRLAGVQACEQFQGGVMHLWGASERRLRAKHILYQMTETLRWPNKSHEEIRAMYTMATKGRPQVGDIPSRWTYAEAPESWWSGHRELLAHLDVERIPWQEAEISRLLDRHGKERFTGLDLICAD